VATGDLRVSGALVTADTETGRATAIERISIPIAKPTGKEAAEPAEPPEPGEPSNHLEAP
jgi:hypothetical protein